MNHSKPLDVAAGESPQPRRDAETLSPDLIAERDAARQAQGLAELRAAQYETERDSAFAARGSTAPASLAVISAPPLAGKVLPPPQRLAADPFRKP